MTRARGVTIALPSTSKPKPVEKSIEEQQAAKEAKRKADEERKVRRSTPAQSTTLNSAR
jgi:hypothetical protein